MTTIWSTTARLALQAAKDYKPDAILLDIGLPGMDGYQVCRAFRDDQMFKTIPIIAQTGWGQERDKASASAAGLTIILSNPSGSKSSKKFSESR